MAFFKISIPTFTTISISADNQVDAYRKARELNHNAVNLDNVLECYINLDALKQTADEDLDMEEETIDNEDFIFEQERYNRFVLDMRNIEIPFDEDRDHDDDNPLYLRKYSGRFMYGTKCPAVYCADAGDVQKVMTATSVECRQDGLGLGVIVYPA